MCWPDPAEKPAVKTAILEDDTAAKSAAEVWARRNEIMAVSGTWTWWMDGSPTYYGWVVAATACSNRDGWTVFRSYLGSGWIEVFDSELCVIEVARRMFIAQSEALQAPGVTMVAVFSDLQAAIRRTVHQDPGPGQQLARAINGDATARRAHNIEAPIHCVPGHSGIPWDEQTDCQPNNAQEDRGYSECERIFTSAENSATRIWNGRTVAKGMWEANKRSKHYGYSLQGKAGSKRFVPITNMKSWETRFYRPKSGHALSGTYLKRFGHREHAKCYLCGSRMPQTREHLFRHCSPWRDQQTALWKAVGKATGWKVGRCPHVQISELFSMEKCDQAVMDFLEVAGIRKFAPKLAEEPGLEKPGLEEHKQEGQGQVLRSMDWGRSVSRFIDLSRLCLFSSVSFSLIMCTWLIFLCHRGRRVAGGSSAILPARPEAVRGVSSSVMLELEWIQYE